MGDLAEGMDTPQGLWRAEGQPPGDMIHISSNTLQVLTETTGPDSSIPGGLDDMGSSCVSCDARAVSWSYGHGRSEAGFEMLLNIFESALQLPPKQFMPRQERRGVE